MSGRGTIQTGEIMLQVYGYRLLVKKYYICRNLDSLRKGIKIKACSVFLAWMLIFVHNIIPHNHLQDNITGCHELVHSANPSEDDCSGPLKFKPEPGDINVCHISNLLYQQFSTDTFISCSDRSADNSTIDQTGIIIFITDEPFIRDSHYGFVPLRAPPSA